MIDEDIEELGGFCFFGQKPIQEVGFRPSSRVVTFRMEAFALCINLVSISIPSSVKSLRQGCFRGCEALATVLFAPDSSVDAIPSQAFMGCRSLNAIRIPASALALYKQCFAECSALTSVSFEPGSALSEIVGLAFHRCIKLESICLPSSILTVAEHCFDGCLGLRRVTFASPSRVTELASFPVVSADPFAVPDSVEICDVTQLMRTSVHRVLSFGAASKLVSVEMNRRVRAKQRRLFLDLSSPILKRFRSRLEFDESDDSD
jgi:hypothetical protein